MWSEYLQLHHCLRRPAPSGPDCENGHGQNEHALAAKDVTQLSPYNIESYNYQYTITQSEVSLTHICN